SPERLGARSRRPSRRARARAACARVRLQGCRTGRGRHGEVHRGTRCRERTRPGPPAPVAGARQIASLRKVSFLPVQKREHYNVPLAVLTFACAAFAIQQTMVIPALPALERELGTTTTWVTWVLTAFLLSASVATPLLGKLGDQHGKERLLVVSLGI